METKPPYENTPKLTRLIPNFYRHANDNSRLGAKFALFLVGVLYLLWWENGNENAWSRRCTSGKTFFSVSLFFNSKITLYCSEMAQQFANDDLFDAELGEDSDGGQNGDYSEDEKSPKSPAPDKENQVNSNEEAANSDSDEETMPKKKNKQRKRESRKKVS